MIQIQAQSEAAVLGKYAFWRGPFKNSRKRPFKRGPFEKSHILAQSEAAILEKSRIMAQSEAAILEKYAFWTGQKSPFSTRKAIFRSLSVSHCFRCLKQSHLDHLGSKSSHLEAQWLPVEPFRGQSGSQ